MEHQVKDGKKGTLASRLPRLTRRSPAQPATTSSPLCPDSITMSGSGKTSSNGSGSLTGSAGTSDSGVKRFSLFRRPSFGLRSKKKVPQSPVVAVAPPTMVPMRLMGGDTGNRDLMGSSEKEFSFCESPCDESNSATLKSKSSHCSSVDSKGDAGSGSRFSRGFRFSSGGERSSKKVKRSLSDSFARESLLSSATRGVFRSCIRPDRNSGEFDTAVMTGYRNAAVALPLLELAEETDPRELPQQAVTPAATEEERSPGVGSLESATERPLRFVKTASADNVCEVWSLTGSRESSVFQNVIVKTQSTSSHVWERNQAEVADDSSRAGEGKSPRKFCQAGGVVSAASQPVIVDAHVQDGSERVDKEQICRTKSAAAPSDEHNHRTTHGALTPYVNTIVLASPLTAQAQARPNQVDGARQSDPLWRSVILPAVPGGELRSAGVSHYFYQGGSTHFSAIKPRSASASCSGADALVSNTRAAGTRDNHRSPESVAASGPKSLAWSVNESVAHGSTAERSRAQELHIEEAATHRDEVHGREGPGLDGGSGGGGGGDVSYTQRALPLKAGGRAPGVECLRRLSEGSEEEGVVDDGGGGLAETPSLAPRHRQHDDDRRDRGESFASSGVNSMDMLHSLGSLELDEDDLMLDSEHLELSLNGLSLLTGGIDPLQNPGDIRQWNLQQWTENAHRGHARTRSECSQHERAEQAGQPEPPCQRTSSACAGDPVTPLPLPLNPTDHGNGAPQLSPPLACYPGRSLPPLGASPPWLASRPPHPRSLHELPWSSDEGLCSPEQRGTTYRHIMADCTALKTMLFRLRRVLHEEPDVVSPSPATPPSNLFSGKEEVDCLDKVLLLEEIERLREKVHDQERVIERLQTDLEEKGSDGGQSSSAAGSFEPRPLRTERGTQTKEPMQPANMCHHPTTDTVASVADTLAATQPSEAPSETARPELQFGDVSQFSCDNEVSGRKTEQAVPAETSRSQQHASDGICCCASCSILIDCNGKLPGAQSATNCRSCASLRERLFDPQACCRPRAVSASVVPEVSEATLARPPDETTLLVCSYEPGRDEERFDNPCDGAVGDFCAGSAKVARIAEPKNGISVASLVDLQRHAAQPLTSDTCGKCPDFAAGAANSLDSSTLVRGVYTSAEYREPIESAGDRSPKVVASKLRGELMARRQIQTELLCDRTQGPGCLTSSPAAAGGDLRCFSPLPGHLAQWTCSEGEISDNSSGIAVSGEGNCCQLIAQDKPGFIVSV